MELGDYTRIIRRRGWLIILLAVLTAGAAFGFSRMQDTVYKSALKLLVRPSRTDFGQAQAAKTLLRGYVAWLDSSYQAAAVIDRLQLDMEPQALKGDVTIASDDSSYIIRIDVKNGDPNIANDIARVRFAEIILPLFVRGWALQLYGRLAGRKMQPYEWLAGLPYKTVAEIRRAKGHPELKK